MQTASTGLPSGYDVRETADAGAGTGTAPAALNPSGDRTFTEGEAYAIVADNVRRETAAVTTENETLKREKSELETKLETADAALATEKAAREKAEKDLADFKAEQEREAAAAAVKDERVAKVRETAKHLGDDFFTAERAARWAGMEQERFDDYIAELAELSKGIEAPKGAGADKDKGAGGAPRETAMAGSSVSGGTSSDKPKGLAGLGAVLPIGKVS